MWAIGASLLRTRSAALIGVLTFSTLATGVLLICLPLQLRQLHATPGEIGIALSMYGFGMFAFEWLWGVVADRFGYRAPLVVSLLLYAVAIFALSRAGSIVLVAVAYFFASGMMVAVGPIARSYIGTSLRPALRATGLALLSAQWVIAEAFGSGAGGALIERMPISDVIAGVAVLPVVAAALCAWVLRDLSIDAWRGAAADDGEGDGAREKVGAVLAITAAVVLLVQVGAGGELALLPLLVTSHLHLSAASAGSAMLVVGLIGGLLLVPGGGASDRWGRRPTMIAGGVVSALGFVIYATAGGFVQVLVGAAVRALGAALIWPAATAWIAEAMPRRRHAFYMGVFGEFENVGITIGPVIGGLVWTLGGIQAAFYVYAVAALAASAVAWATVHDRTHAGVPVGRSA